MTDSGFQREGNASVHQMNDSVPFFQGDQSDYRLEFDARSVRVHALESEDDNRVVAGLDEATAREIVAALTSQFDNDQEADSPKLDAETYDTGDLPREVQ